MSKITSRISHLKYPLLFVIAAAMGAATYLGWATATGVGGFALDDAWIHQTYARNFAATGSFDFIPSQPSAGSTSPLWTLLIAVGYLVHADYKVWTYALSAACLVMTAFGVWGLSLLLFPEHPRAALAAGILCALEWHLIWAAVSGMETVLFTAISVWLLILVNLPQSEKRISGNALIEGLCYGTLVLTRPEGLLLVGWVLSARVARGEWKRRATWTSIAWLVIGMMLLLAPWLAFNWFVSGTPFPNTFYAKQREYASLLAAIPLYRRFAQVMFQPFIGAQVLLIPGLIAAAWALARRINKPATWVQLAPLAWVIAHLGLYALRLPVTYQHGRYEMPVIPILIVLGVGGTASFLRGAWRDARLWPRVLSRATVLAIAVIQVGFVVIGARAYAADVAIIEGEMVSVARWLDGNTAPDALIAAHDIGAIGYYTRRPLIDLAGLISPEVIPVIRDEEHLWALMQQRRAAYLVTFPSWYPRLTAQPALAPTFEGSAPGVPEHMTVYRLPFAAVVEPIAAPVPPPHLPAASARTESAGRRTFRE